MRPSGSSTNAVSSPLASANRPAAVVQRMPSDEISSADSIASAGLSACPGRKPRRRRAERKAVPCCSLGCVWRLEEAGRSPARNSAIWRRLGGFGTACPPLIQDRGFAATGGNHHRIYRCVMPSALTCTRVKACVCCFGAGAVVGGGWRESRVQRKSEYRPYPLPRHETPRDSARSGCSAALTFVRSRGHCATAWEANA